MSVLPVCKSSRIIKKFVEEIREQTVIARTYTHKLPPEMPPHTASNCEVMPGSKLANTTSLSTPPQGEEALEVASQVAPLYSRQAAQPPLWAGPQKIITSSYSRSELIISQTWTAFFWPAFASNGPMHDSLNKRYSWICTPIMYTYQTIMICTLVVIEEQLHEPWSMLYINILKHWELH